MRNEYERFTRNKEKVERYRKQFHKVFGLQLYSYLNIITGFDIIKFDKHLCVPGGISTREYINQKYGEDAVRLIEMLL